MDQARPVAMVVVPPSCLSGGGYIAKAGEILLADGIPFPGVKLKSSMPRLYKKGFIELPTCRLVLILTWSNL